MLRTLLACAALLLFAALPPAPAGAEPVRATINGAEAVNVRRGPGLDTTAFAALRQGASVLVEERVGQWALVLLDSGERGYVNAAFLDVAAGGTIPTAAPTGPVEGTPTIEATREPTATSVPALDRELAALRERLATLEASVEHGGGTGRTPIAAAGEPPPVVVPAVVEPPASLDVGPSLALAGVGFLVGFLFGTFYGQRQERNRRLRVRF